MLGKPTELLAFFAHWRSYFPSIPVLTYFCLLLLARKEHFPFLFMLYSAIEEPFPPIFVFFCGTFFWTYGVREYLRACCRRASSVIYNHHRTSSAASTAQYNTAVNPRHKQQSKGAPIRARQPRQAGGVGSSQYVLYNSCTAPVVHGSAPRSSEGRRFRSVPSN